MRVRNGARTALHCAGQALSQLVVCEWIRVRAGPWAVQVMSGRCSSWVRAAPAGDQANPPAIDQASTQPLLLAMSIMVQRPSPAISSSLRPYFLFEGDGGNHKKCGSHRGVLDASAAPHYPAYAGRTSRAPAPLL